MSNWMITLEYLREYETGGNESQYIYPSTIRYTYSSNIFVNFKGEYPIQVEIESLIDANSEIEKHRSYDGSYYETKRKPAITFMQKLM